jgi:hypothetical protein
MFRDRWVPWARMLNFFTCTISIMLVHMKAMKANVKAGFSNRSWESITEERKFERNLAVRQAYNSLLLLPPVSDRRKITG